MEVNVEKATNKDKWKLLSRALPSGYLEDFDDEFVYFEVWEDEGYFTYKAPYTLEGVAAEINVEEKVKVEETTEYVDKPNLESIISKCLSKYFTDTKNAVQVVKSFNDEQMVVIEPLYIAFGEVDAHGDTYKDKDSVHQLVSAFNTAVEKNVLKASLFHMHETESFSPVKAFVYDKEVMLGDNLIPPLQPMVEVQFNNKKAFELRKSMDLLGVSINARAMEEKVKNSGSDDEISYLSEFTFMFDGGHLAYTSASQGGAASMKNEYYLTKSLNKSDLSELELTILEEIDEEFSPLSKSAVPTKEGDAAITKEKDGINNMSEKEKELEAQILELTKKLEKTERDSLVSNFSEVGFEGDQAGKLADACLSLNEDNRAEITKAFSEMKDKFDQASTDVEAAKKEVEVLKKKSLELDKSELESELGHTQEEKEDTDQSLLARVTKARTSKESE